MQQECQDGRATTIVNFGENVRFQPKEFYQPASEQEVISILNRNPGCKVRVIGSRHAWSELIVTNGIALDLTRLNSITLNDDETATIGAGAKVKDLLVELNRHGLTLPSVGLITQQAIAGATATGTHGSGKNSLSHYLTKVRLVACDHQGECSIEEFDSGDELKAARCSLGAMGIITSVTIPVRSQYQVEEHFATYDKLEDALAVVDRYPLQQLFLIPWNWKIYAQHRVEVEQPRSSLAWLYRLYWRVGIDVLLHVAVKANSNWLPRLFNRLFWKRILPVTVPRHWNVVDRSDRQLTMGHHLFRHIEMELFVRESKAPQALDFVKSMIRHAGGDSNVFAEEIQQKLTAAGLWDDVVAIRGTYDHHYPVCLRRILPDDTLISPSSVYNEPSQSISLICYQHPQKRETFFEFAEVLFQGMRVLFEARAHWGKYLPPISIPVRDDYESFSRFRQICLKMGQNERFSNPMLEGILGR